MKFSIRGLFAFQFTLAISHFWKKEPVGITSDYELERFYIAGFQYHRGPDLIEEMSHGAELVLVRENDNPHDPLAVALHFGNDHIGYVPRQRNRAVAALLDQGAPMHARITQVDPDADPWHAVEVAVRVSAASSARAVGKCPDPLFSDLL